jgi:hypothetical protein
MRLMRPTRLRRPTRPTRQTTRTPRAKTIPRKVSIMRTNLAEQKRAIGSRTACPWRPRAHVTSIINRRKRGHETLNRFPCAPYDVAAEVMRQTNPLSAAVGTVPSLGMFWQTRNAAPSPPPSGEKVGMRWPTDRTFEFGSNLSTEFTKVFIPGGERQLMLTPAKTQLFKPTNPPRKAPTVLRKAMQAQARSRKPPKKKRPQALPARLPRSAHYLI